MGAIEQHNQSVWLLYASRQVVDVGQVLDFGEQAMVCIEVDVVDGGQPK